MKSFSWRHGLARVSAAAAIVVAVSACGGHNHLSEYNFTSRSLALVYIAPPRPELVTGWYNVPDVNDPVAAVVAAGSGVAKEVEGRRARARLDSATALIDLSALMSQRTLERTSRYLGATPVANRQRADFLLEVNVHNSGIDLRRQSTAYLFMNATAVLMDARTGREIWSFDVDGRNRLTPFLYGGNHVGTGAITAAALSTVSVADFQRAMEDLADFSSNAISDELRGALREVRQ